MQRCKHDLLITNIGQLVTPEGEKARKGPEQGQIQIREDTYVKVKDGLIDEVGTMAQLQAEQLAGEKVIDARGSLVTPGLVDPHTHLIFAGWRQKELALKLKGVGYLEILEQGGGILNTVRNTKAASAEQLKELAERILDRMLTRGVTTCEAKSGYGLDLENELKSLRVIKKLNEDHLVDVVPTFMGAHAVPQEYQGRSADFVRLVKEEMIPEVARLRLAEFNDVFCEQGVFDLAESKRYWNVGRNMG